MGGDVDEIVSGRVCVGSEGSHGREFAPALLKFLLACIIKCLVQGITRINNNQRGITSMMVTCQCSAGIGREWEKCVALYETGVPA